jgi:hypothetical protein
MFNQLATDSSKTPETSQPELPGIPYKPYSDKPALPEPPYKPYDNPLHDAPYEPYKGI